MKINSRELPEKFEILYQDNYWAKLTVEELALLIKEFNEWNIKETLKESLNNSE